LIPLIVHQTAKTTDIPEQWRGFQHRVRSLHPSWEYKLWTDEENLALVSQSAPRWLPLYNVLPRAIMRVDMIRYIILYLFGGLYLDLDYEVFRPFDLVGETLVLPRESDPGEEVFLGNCILASVPGHPFWEHALTELETSFSRLGRKPLEQDVIWLTGPGLLTRTYQKHGKNDATICIPPRNSFHPRTPRNQKEYMAVREIPGVYGVHHCAGTWRAKNMSERIGRKLSGFLAHLGRHEKGQPEHSGNGKGRGGRT
jgi:mannosyltransferase OCH1-like enzyme